MLANILILIQTTCETEIKFGKYDFRKNLLQDFKNRIF
jgi:hypothetical protein